MKTIKYLGPPNTREVTKEQFVGRGVEDQDTITLVTTGPNGDANRTIQVSDSAADLLLLAEASEWELVSEEADVQPDGPEAKKEDTDKTPEAPEKKEDTKPAKRQG